MRKNRSLRKLVNNVYKFFGTIIIDFFKNSANNF